MKKQLFILPLLMACLSACGNQNNSNADNSSKAQETSDTETSTQSQNDGSSVVKAFTIDEMIEFMSSFESGTPSQTEYYVRGTLGDSSYNSEHNSYTAYFENHMKGSATPAKIYSGVLDSSITGNYTAMNALAGATVVVKGYLELFNGEYEIPYLNAKYSPSGSAASPVILSVEGGNPGTDSGDQGGGEGQDSGDQGGGQDSGDQGGGTETKSGVCGDNAVSTGTIPENAQTLSFDFTSGTIEGITATSSSKPNASGVATIGGYEFNYTNAIAHAASDYVSTGYLGLCAKGGNGIASFANKTAIPGKIVKVEVKMPKELSSGSVSANAPFVIDFGTTALGNTDNTTGATGGSEATLYAFTSDSIEASYFSVSVIKGVSSKGAATWYNGSLASITVTYVA